MYEMFLSPFKILFGMSRLMISAADKLAEAVLS